ncbi:hypothetical protein [Streptomyces sp. NPDC014622]|uniref:hypothetical protein n=1 Tax=Streptomyces sp. NPDC014622 TaxID=3364874 RepID=UPI003701931D
MAEISYPFNADNATTGAAKAVSETQWQAMAHLWGGDRVDYRLSTTETTTSIPFSASVVNVTTVQVKPGKAWVGGFYYELTAAKNVTIAANTANSGRKDLVVIRADMAVPSVTLAVRKGVNAATPVVPQPVRQAGGVWELPLCEIEVPANGAPIILALRTPFDLPAPSAFPWNARESVPLTPPNSFGYDLDSNGGDSQTEYFNGRDGMVISRTLGPPMTYTPAITTTGVLNKTGRWKWIAPNTVWFTARIENPTNADVKNPSGISTAIGITLPVPASGEIGQIFPGHLDNNALTAAGLPNFVDLTAKVNKGGSTSTAYLYYPNPSNLAQGLDFLVAFPRKSFITVSGVYEASVLN